MIATEPNCPVLIQWNILFEEYPLLRHFSIYDLINLSDISKAVFHHKDMYDDFINQDEETLNCALDRFHTFFSKQDSQFRFLFKYTYSELTNSFVPKRKSIKALWNTKTKQLKDLSHIYFYTISKQLINKGFNPDLILSQLEEVLGRVNNKDDLFYDVSNHGIHLSSLKISNIIVSFLQGFYNDKRIIRLFFYGYLIKGESSSVTELIRILQALKDINIGIPEDVLPDKPKNFQEIFGPMAACYDEENILLTEDFQLKCWNNYQEFHDQTWNYNDRDYKIHIPKTRHELVHWGRRFQNCVGYKESYISEIQLNHAILFFLTYNDYPVYCVFNNIYDNQNFEARGLNNDELYIEEEGDLFALGVYIQNFILI